MKGRGWGRRVTGEKKAPPEDKRNWNVLFRGDPPPSDHLIIYSFDPAINNYGMRVEKRESNGRCTTLYMKCIDLMAKQSELDGVDVLYSNLSVTLEEIIKMAPSPHLVIVERQPPINYWTVRLSQHTISYFSIRTRATIVEVNPKTCLGILGCPTESKVRKKWSVEWATSYMNYMGDNYGKGIMDGKIEGGTRGKGGIHRGGVKVDDMAITICQSAALMEEWKKNNNWFPVVRERPPFVICIIPKDSSTSVGSAEVTKREEIQILI